MNTLNCEILNLAYNNILSYILVSNMMCDIHTIRVEVWKYSLFDASRLKNVSSLKTLQSEPEYVGKCKI